MFNELITYWLYKKRADKTITTLVLMFSFLVYSAATVAASPDASKLMQEYFERARVDDEISRVTFTFSKPGEEDKKLVYRVFWKNYGADETFISKTLFFAEYPPAERGKSYLGMYRKPGSGEKDAEWIYLPDLRQVMRLTTKDGHHHQHDHNKDHKDELFGKSVLNRSHLDPRPPSLDNHQFVIMEDVNGRPHYMIESRPKSGDRSFPYSKIIYWLDKDNKVASRIHFVDQLDSVSVTMNIDWQEEKGKWVWKKVVGRNTEKNETTTIDSSKIHVNVGLEDGLFSKRNMEKGLENLRL